jgi:mRNA-degrading endonuclease YafQ of YafQ-DinJ toxin-antitoxin module
MYELVPSNNFRKQYFKLIEKDSLVGKRIDKVTNFLQVNPFHPGLNTHVIGNHRKYGNIYSSRVTGDIRILWAISPSEELVILLLKIGGHDFVY